MFNSNSNLSVCEIEPGILLHISIFFSQINIQHCMLMNVRAKKIQEVHWEEYTHNKNQQRLCLSTLGFPDCSVGKESACKAGDPGSIPGLGRSAGEGVGYPLQYSSASVVAQLVINLPAMQETWVRSLGWEDPLEKGKATHSSVLSRSIPWTVKPIGLQRVGHD